MKKLLHLGMALVLAVVLAGCNGDDDVVFVSGPGFVGIDDITAGREPALIVRYIDPATSLLLETTILSDPAFDGDIAFDPVFNTFTVTTSPTVLFFGIDSFDVNDPEFRAFLTFPRGTVPPGAVIDNAILEVAVTEVSFASTVPTFLDLVPYGVLGIEDFDAAFLAFRTLDFFSSDVGLVVAIDVTPLVQTAQDNNVADFQFRFSLDQTVAAAGAQPARPDANLKKAPRSASPSSSAPNRSARQPLADRPTRSR